MSWRLSHVTVNDSRGKSYEYTDIQTIGEIQDALSKALKDHPNATSIVMVLVRELKPVT